MKLENIKRIAVAGAGTMGCGIAQLAAMAGYETLLFDVNEKALSTAHEKVGGNLQGAVERGKMTVEEKDKIVSAIKTTSRLEELVADVVIEAVLERLDIKKDLFSKLAAINSAETILATNTSTIPVTQIAYGIPNPERVVGMHFFNPAHIMKLVEIISGAATSDEVAQTTKLLAEKMGKTTVIAKDAPGFIVNRVARHYYVEGLKLLEENVASLETIDALMENNGFKMGAFPPDGFNRCRY